MSLNRGFTHTVSSCFVLFFLFFLCKWLIIDVFPAFKSFVSILPKVPRCFTDGLLDHFQYFLAVLSEQRCCNWNKSWFGASQIKANALNYCHEYCKSVIHTYSTSADFQPFKWRIIAYGRFWSASPAGEANKLIFRTISLCLSKTIMNMSFLFVQHQRIQKMPPPLRKHREDHSAYIFRQRAFWHWSRVFNHPSSDPAPLSFYHWQNGLSAFVLKSTDDVQYAALSFIISNDLKSALVKPQENWIMETCILTTDSVPSRTCGGASVL